MRCIEFGQIVFTTIGCGKEQRPLPTETETTLFGGGNTAMLRLRGGRSIHPL